MSTIDEKPSIAPSEAEPSVDDNDRRTRRLRILRYTAIAVWASVVVYRTITDGFAFNRELLLLYISTGLLAASIGQGRRMLYVIRDWLPFALVLVAYDLSRGAATLIGRPTLWQWQVDADRWLFFGTVPTVWLQERLKLPHPPWWEVVISTVYMSFFILPYVVAGVLWLRDRDEWKRFVRLFVGLSFAALAIYALLPAAPPWAAARCTSADVDGGPSGPRCMFRSAREVSDGGLLGAMQSSQDGANDWIERIVARGWGKLNLHSATALIDQGQASVNLVAAIPSLHAGLTAAVAAFLWHRVHRKWRPLLVAYPLIMAFTLVYTAEHYVIDILLGWALAAVVVFALNRFDARRRSRAGQVDLAESLGDGPDGAGAGLQADEAAGAELHGRAAVGELDRA
ncbi:phosphatase PAP2 family protein [Mycolicibacterium wolinskyi]|uniref:Phosphoesterase n=1 Tax=Mycolicibacterium wolinskyi TaxID=59750 RepID=A0A1X2EZH6_9MYCO|nr:MULTISPECIES: phosphatase PAP2 family protein [Mycolicibacterium]MCV7288273.1 phosphatase PAP2 family protein [Mycolicibacterium wolinskyi]MCV7295495.1 phosphatase PAP2 family protein [Mycolicibacterium goodii]ORX11536.1 phosphoesterase [Mycolicibacterium wolinskyi]